MLKIWILYFQANGEHTKVLYANPSEDKVRTEKERRERLDSRLAGHLYVVQANESGIEPWHVAYPFGDKTTNYRQVTGQVWQHMAPFYFPGTSDGAQPDKFRVFGYLNNSSKTGYVRLFDATNNLVLAQVQFNGNTESELKIADINNLPSSEATIEIQAQVSSGGKLNLESIEVR